MSILLDGKKVSLDTEQKLKETDTILAGSEDNKNKQLNEINKSRTTIWNKVIEEENKLETIEDKEDEESIPNVSDEEEDIKLKVEKTVNEKQSSTLSSDIYDPELDLSNYKYPKVDLLNNTTDKKIQVTKDELTSNKNRIIETLKNFKIEI